jgi:putative transposase
VVPECAHHITQRGNYQQPVFSLDHDRQVYLEILKENAARHRLRLLGYCLMTNHVHLLAVPEHIDSMAKAIGRTHNDYARWMNVRERHVGHLWQNRYFSCPLDEAHCWEALRYIEMNPVRAGVVHRAQDWRWSSAPAHLNIVGHGGLLDLSSWAARFSAETWREVLDLGLHDAAMAARLREATRTGRPMGSSEFVKSLESRLSRTLRPAKRGPRAGEAAVSRHVSLGSA